ncbi:MAG: single-stranded DNA-binding protein [Chloroflexota bacterium]|nr:MAG: single-stranded DNA-binding protein [Chloroflexota bacterium]
MAGLNKVMLIGNVGTEPEMRYTEKGTPVTSFRMAVSRNFNMPDGERREETEWFSIVAWNKLAEICNQYLNKGKKVYVEGRLHTRSWEGQDGQKRYRTEIVAGDVQFLDRSGTARSGGEPEADEGLDPDDLPF